MKTADISPCHFYFPREMTSAEDIRAKIPYLWRVTTQIGWSKFPSRQDQLEVLSRSKGSMRHQ